MAIGRWLEVTASISGANAGVDVVRSGTLAGLSCSCEDDLIWRGFAAACAALGHAPPESVHFTASSDIPVARGLGSSAAAIVAGASLANRIFAGDLDSAAIIDIAASLEGHPDNVAPSVIGGAVLSVRSTRYRYQCVPLAVHPSLRFVFAVPDFEVRTSVARAALPERVEFETAVGAAAHAAALIAGLQSGDAALLRLALDDFLHVPFRRSLVRGYDAVTTAAIAAGAIGATLSGSGSSVVAVAVNGSAGAVADAMIRAWHSVGVEAEAFLTTAQPNGATIVAQTGA
jgi:homoserine kinase